MIRRSGGRQAIHANHGYIHYTCTASCREGLYIYMLHAMHPLQIYLVQMQIFVYIDVSVVNLSSKDSQLLRHLIALTTLVVRIV